MTDLNRLSHEHRLLNQLIRRAQAWPAQERQLLAVLPPNLRQRCRAVRVREEDGTLVLHAADNLAASRLRMLAPALLGQWQQLDAGIRQVSVRLVPLEPVVEKHKQARLSRHAADECLRAAEALSAHPELAAALRRLAAKAEDGSATE